MITITLHVFEPNHDYKYMIALKIVFNYKILQ